MRKTFSLASAILLAGALGIAAPTAYAGPPTADALSRLNIDPSRIAITGLSSGAFMAMQAHLAYPDVFKKAAIVAGGPYACAEGFDAKMVATGGLVILKCMSDYDEYSATQWMSEQNISSWADLASERAKYKDVRGGGNSRFTDLDGSTVYFLHGKNDATVIPIVAEAAKKVYQQLMIKTNPPAGMPIPLRGDQAVRLNLIDDGQGDFAHTFPTDKPRRPGNDDDCNQSKFPYLGHCGIDGAKLILSNLFGPTPAQPPATPAAQLSTVDQTRIPGYKDAVMDDKGYAYIPPVCLLGEACGVVVALHGCNQSANSRDPENTDPNPVGDRFATGTGFNRWAEAYRIIVLYPQVLPTQSPAYALNKANFNGCWDWWGYTGKDYDLRSGKQMSYLVDLLKSFGYGGSTSN